MNLWMRWVSFQALREILLLVKACPAKLRAADLARIATEDRVLLSQDGKALGASSHYHHRRTLERLGFLVKRHGRYLLNEEMPEARGLTERETFGRSLNEAEKVAFANVILRNQDCHHAFFTSFLQPDQPVRDVYDFVARGRPIEMSVASGGRGSRRRTDSVANSHAKDAQITIQSSWTPVPFVRTGENALQAIHFGLRSWCIDQLDFLDSLYRVDKEYTIYPKYIIPRIPTQQLELKMFDALSFDHGWTTVRVGDFALEVGIRQRIAVEQAGSVLQSWLDRHRDVVAGIATRERLIAGGLASAQRDLVLKGFLQDQNGAYISHLQIHESLRRKFEEEEHSHGCSTRESTAI